MLNWNIIALYCIGFVWFSFRLCFFVPCMYFRFDSFSPRIPSFSLFRSLACHLFPYFFIFLLSSRFLLWFSEHISWLHHSQNFIAQFSIMKFTTIYLRWCSHFLLSSSPLLLFLTPFLSFHLILNGFSVI